MRLQTSPASALMMKAMRLSTIVLSILAFAAPVGAQLSEAAKWTATANYRVTPNVTYLTASNWEAKLDVYQPLDTAGPVPVLVYIHGGGWVGGSREGSVMNLLPYLELGWAAVNVSYRLARVAQAPAAVEDCLCALRWVYRNAKTYGFDTSRIVVTGHSAGGHLSLTTSITPASAGLDRQCPGTETLRVAAVVNWYGITDVNDLLEGANRQTYAVTWLGSLTDREQVARRVSPLTYVRSGLPPILTIHGDADTVVPYTHALRMHEALNKAGVANQLHTVPGGKHGGFSREERLKIFEVIHGFLKKHNLGKAAGTASGGE